MNASAFLALSAEVQAALQQQAPVVALESTIISHGMPWPENVETALRVEAAVREAGAVPATVAVLQGRLCAGLSPAQIDTLGRAGTAMRKLSRRDLPFVLADQGQGATTVAATMIVAALAGIRLFATGGIGGVHRGAQDTMDISADLLELARTPVAVVCAGAKAILDLPRTLEVLETQGVPIVGYGSNELPAFYSRAAMPALALPWRLDTPQAVALALRAQDATTPGQGMVVAQPIAVEHEIPAGIIQGHIDQALAEARAQGIAGAAVTPFLLARIAALTGGASLAANIELVLANARLAGRIAVAYAALGPA